MEKEIRKKNNIAVLCQDRGQFDRNRDLYTNPKAEYIPVYNDDCLHGVTFFAYMELPYWAANILSPMKHVAAINSRLRPWIK